MELYKLTEQDNTTYNGSTKWGINMSIELPEKENPRLCSSDVIHACKNINLAFLLNPIHGDINNPKIWQAEGNIVVHDFGKVGCFKLTTHREILKPKWIESDYKSKVRIMFAILCAEAVLCHYEKYNSDDKRVREAINAAKAYLKNPVPRAAAWAARAAVWAARAAVWAAEAAAEAASDIDFCLLADKAVELIEKEPNK